MTDSEVSRAEIEQLVAGEHHDPHSILGAHPGPDGVVIRALRPMARSVTLVLDDGRRLRRSRRRTRRCCAGPSRPPWA